MNIESDEIILIIEALTQYANNHDVSQNHHLSSFIRKQIYETRSNLINILDKLQSMIEHNDLTLISEYTSNHVEECASHMRAGMSWEDASNEVQLHHGLDDVTANSVLIAACQLIEKEG